MSDASASLDTSKPRSGAGLRLSPLSGAMVLLLFLGALAMAFPIGLSRDYFNHLARNHIEAQIWADPDLQRHYALSFAVIPDLTMDLIIPWLSQLVGTWRAGALTILLALILPVFGGLLVAREAHGRVTWLSLGGFLAAFNVGLEWGFVNYVASSGIALIGFAFWMRSQPGRARMVGFGLFGLFLALNHALAFLLFGFLALVWEIASYAENERGNRWAFLNSLLRNDLPAMVPGVALIGFAMMGASDLPRGTAEFFSLSQKAYGFSSGFYFFNPGIGFVALVGTCGLAAWLLLKRYVQLPRKMAWVCCGLLVLNLLMPTSVMGIWGLHLRFTAPLVILFFASARLSPEVPVMARRVVSFGLASLMALVFLNGGMHMARQNAEANELRALFDALPRGARLLAAYENGPSLDFPFVMHASGIAVIERSAYVPNLFTNTSPVDVAPQNIHLHMPQSLPLSAEMLREAAKKPSAFSANGFWSMGFADNWPERWTHLVFFTGQPGDSLSGLPVCEKARTGSAVLYRIGGC